MNGGHGGGGVLLSPFLVNACVCEGTVSVSSIRYDNELLQGRDTAHETHLYQII